MGFYLIQALGSWPGLRTSGVRGPADFIDQKSILNSAKCFRRLGIDVYQQNVNTSNCGGFQYSIELLRFLNFSRLSSLSSYTLGNFFIIGTLLIFSLLFILIRSKGKSDNLVALIALTSPGIWLLFERGNYDSFIYIIVVLGLILIRSKFEEVGILLIAASVLMKFYTLPLLIISTLILKRRSSRRIAFIMVIPLVMYVFILIRKVTAFPSTWYVSFGLKSPGLYLELFIKEKISNSYLMNPMLAILIGFLLLAIMLKLLISIEAKPSFASYCGKAHDCANRIYFGLLVVFLSCYFAGMNFDYRLIYPATLIGISSQVLNNNRFRSIMIVSGLLAVWLSTFSFGLHGVPVLLIQFIGDFFLILFTATQLLLAFYRVLPILVAIQNENPSSGMARVITLLKSMF